VSASSAGARSDPLELDVGEECYRCGEVLEYVGIGKSDRRYERRTVHEYLSCPGCGAGGALVKLAENDRIVRRYGPATRALRGRSAEYRERSRERDGSAAPRAQIASGRPMLEGWSD
jgi:hypothetical protein